MSFSFESINGRLSNTAGYFPSFRLVKTTRLLGNKKYHIDIHQRSIDTWLRQTFTDYEDLHIIYVDRESPKHFLSEEAYLMLLLRWKD
jgi:hypothetical protein